MSGTTRIGIIGLGWLGESLADFFHARDFSVWGTVRSEDKAGKIRQKGIAVSLWESHEAISEEVRQELKKLDILILNLPPSAFSKTSYAEGLSSFLQYINDEVKVIFTSSTGVYPENLADAKEDYVFRPEESNRLLEAERVLEKQLGKRLCILRLAGLIGEDRHPVYYLAKKEVNVDPDKVVNLIHRKDIVQIILKVVEKNLFGEIFNVCHPEHPARKMYYNQIAQNFNLPEIQFQDSESISTNKIVNSCKLQETLGYTKFEDLK